jgi:soluble lytic murein transglycosylase-like protein
VKFRSLVVLALVGIAGCSASGLIPGGPHAMDPVALAALESKAAHTTGVSVNLIDAVVRTESHGDPSAISRSGAQGLMQLMPETARQYGVANAFDPAENVDAGSRYLRDLLIRYHHSMHLALAAYNAGPGSVDAARGMPKYPETRAYVARVLASLQK